MIERFVLWVLRHDLWVLTATAIVLLVAVATMGQTPVDALPDLSENQVLVYTPWPGQQPAEIERRVSQPLSSALRDIPGLVTIRGSSEFHFSLLHLLFADDVSFLEARRLVDDKLRSIKLDLPENIQPQVAADGIPTGQIFWYSVEGAGSDLRELRQIQDNLVAPELRKLPGVAEVASVGGFIAEYQLNVGIDQLAQHSVDLPSLNRSMSGQPHKIRPPSCSPCHRASKYRPPSGATFRYRPLRDEDCLRKMALKVSPGLCI